MLIEDQHPLNKSITVSLMGNPNVGKSSLANYLLGMELNVVTRKPQTTRNRVNCVFTVDRTEIILIDTPGMHKSGHEINKRYNDQARSSSNGADINFIMVDVSRPLFDQIETIKKVLDKEIGKSWLILTKSDKVENFKDLPLQELFDKAKEVFPTLEKYFYVSSRTEENMNILIGSICDEAQSGPHLYPDGRVSNKNERFFTTEYIREQVFELLKDELPYEIAVTLDEFTDMIGKTGEEETRASATILVNRASQRAIVVGAKGSMIKEIGIRARKKIQEVFGRSVHLNLHVKVSPKWFANNYVLEELGLPRAVDSSRVWRSRD